VYQHLHDADKPHHPEALHQADENTMTTSTTMDEFAALGKDVLGV
jgi:hypothetical protein